ncbi:hypothetical protein [Arachnia propionica]|uniref:Uncharacterized protein n=1 Tax=Arachnia propionica TaxID=1750 RepID=A0A3P1WRZ8_9ACTN|nr:hypothetical protein [Arachnia propionica]RRD48547.1 hypothetical protein EII35_12185 [Arachnia propionica]
MRRLLVLLLPVVMTLGCSAGGGEAIPESYELRHIEGNVAGPQGERSYRVDGDTVTIVVRDAQQQVVQERTRVLSGAEREAAAAEISRALRAGTGQVCTDSPEYRLTVDDPSQKSREVTISECFSDEVAPFRELEGILAG